jgi:hypothetical protein
MCRKDPIWAKEAKTKARLAGRTMLAHEIDGKKAYKMAREVVEKQRSEESSSELEK